MYYGYSTFWKWMFILVIAVVLFPLTLAMFLGLFMFVVGGGA